MKKKVAIEVNEKKSGANKKTAKLIEFKSGDKVKIVKIDAGRGALLNLINLGLNIGNITQIGRTSHIGGPVTVIYQGSEIAIGRGLARKIFVEEV